MSTHKKYTVRAGSTPQGDDCECLRAHEVAARLGVSREHVMRLLRAGKLPGFRFGRVWLIRKADLSAHLTQLASAALKLPAGNRDSRQPDTTGGH